MFEKGVDVSKNCESPSRATSSMAFAWTSCHDIFGNDFYVRYYFLLRITLSEVVVILKIKFF